MSTGQAVLIAVGFAAALFAFGMGGGMIADWLRKKVSTDRRPSAEEAGSDMGATPNASGRPAAGNPDEREAFKQALYAWREAPAITGPEFNAVMALYDRHESPKP